MTTERITVENFNRQAFLNEVSSAWPGTVIVDRGNALFPGNLCACVVFCPLYAPGPLSESKLICSPKTIGDSRVAQKADAYLSVLKRADSALKKIDGRLSVKAIFANRAVLFKGNPLNGEEDSLRHHSRLYQDMMTTFSRLTGAQVDFQDYDDLGIQFDRFVDPTSIIPESVSQGVSLAIRPESRVIACLNNYLAGRIPFRIADTRDTRKVVGNLLAIDGVDVNQAFWLIAGYVVFDYMIPRLTGSNAIYIVSERFGPLFNISKLTPELDRMTRVQLKA